MKAILSLSWLKSVFREMNKWFIAAWASIYGVLRWLFMPTAAWGAVWLMLLASFATKMIEIAYDKKRERLSIRTFLDNFSSSVAVHKALPKVLFYSLLMFIVARISTVAPAVCDKAHFAAASLSLTIEIVNSLKHLASIPSLSKLVTEFVGLFKKILGRE